jgi:hypothetical protein
MSQRESGYERKERDLYETPAWVTEALIPHLPCTGCTVWEPAAGGGKIVAALLKAGFDVTASDIGTGRDFLTTQSAPKPIRAIITNPPYEFATEFIYRAIKMTPAHGFVAMLLRTDFDHAKTRADLFADCKLFAKKIVLTKRIKWFENSKGQPSFNHAWFIWDHRHSGAPTLAYGPTVSLQGKKT